MADYGATDAWDFTTNTYIRGGSSAASGLSVTRASSGYAQRTDGIWQSFNSGVLRRTNKGALIESARTNVCTNYNANPDASLSNVNFTNATNGLATFTRVDDTAALAAAALSNICTSGYAFCLDNTAGDTTANVRPIGTSSGGVAHAYSVYARITAGSGADVGTSSTGTGATIISGITYARFVAIITPAGADSLRLRAPAGCRVLFVLNQLEAGSFASSPIVISGASATRAADVVTAVPTSGTDYPVTLFAEIIRLVDTGAIERAFTLSDGTNLNRFMLQTDTGDKGSAATVGGGTADGNSSTTNSVSLNVVSKLAARANTNDLRVALNATLGNADTSVTKPATPSLLTFGAVVTGGTELQGYLRRVAIITRALSDAELQAITT